MKTKVNHRTTGESVAGSAQNEKGKRLVPEKKEKNMKRALFQEIEEDEEIDYLSFKQKGESLEDYYEDEEEENEDYDDEEFDDDDFDEEFDDEDED